MGTDSSLQSLLAVSKHTLPSPSHSQPKFLALLLGGPRAVEGHMPRGHVLSLGKLWCNIPGHACDQVHVVSDRNPPVGHLKRGLTECDQLVKVWMGQDL